MVAIRARFDGKNVILPKDVQHVPLGEVLVVFKQLSNAEEENQLWLSGQESAFAKVWDNDEDAVYDSL